MLNYFPKVNGPIGKEYYLVNKHFTLEELKHYPKHVSIITSVVRMTCLNIAQDAINRNVVGPQVSYAPTQKLSPRFYYHSSFHLPFLYVNYYLFTFSLIAHLFIQHIMMQLPYTGQSTELWRDRQHWDTYNPWISQNNIFTILSLGRLPTPSN